MPIKKLLLTTLLTCQIALPPGELCGQRKVERAGTNQIKCFVTVDSDSWSAGKPAYVLIRLENVSNRDVEFQAQCYFKLNSAAPEVVSRGYQRRGDGYWSPASVVTKEGQLVMVAQDLSKVIPPGRTSKRFPNDVVRLRKGEATQIKVDLTQLLWQDQISSVWPNERLFGLVSKGKYWLNFGMDVNKQKLSSNRVEVRVQ